MQQAPCVVVECEEVLTTRVPPRGMGRKPLEAMACQDLLGPLYLPAVEEQIEVRQSFQPGGDVGVALEVAVANRVLIQSVEDPGHGRSGYRHRASSSNDDALPPRACGLLP